MVPAGLIKIIRTFLSLDFQRRLLFAEAYFYLGWAKLLVSLPFPKVSPSLGVYMKETEKAPNERHKPVLFHVRDAISVVGRHTLWESSCLARAIAGMKMLERRGIESTLYLGTAKDESGNLIAHAWLRSGACYITGAEVMRKYTVTGTFAKEIPSRKTKRAIV